MINKVKIDAVTYNVTETAGPILVNGRSCKGAIDYDANQIELLACIGDSQKQVTLAHEIVHGILFERTIESLVKPDHLENFVDEVGKAIVNLIRDNPDLIRYFQGLAPEAKEAEPGGETDRPEISI